jgi:hypothetical protein
MDHDHHHHHADMTTKSNMVMNHAQRQPIATSDHSGHGSHSKDMMMMVMNILLPAELVVSLMKLEIFRP